MRPRVCTTWPPSAIWTTLKPLELWALHFAWKTLYGHNTNNETRFRKWAIHVLCAWRHGLVSILCDPVKSRVTKSHPMNVYHALRFTDYVPLYKSNYHACRTSPLDPTLDIVTVIYILSFCSFNDRFNIIIPNMVLSARTAPIRINHVPRVLYE